MLFPGFCKVCIRVCRYTSGLDVGAVCCLAQQLHSLLQARGGQQHLNEIRFSGWTSMASQMPWQIIFLHMQRRTWYHTVPPATLHQAKQQQQSLHAEG